MPQDLLLTAARTLEIADDIGLLKALAETVAHAAQLAAKSPDAASAEAFLDNLSQELVRPEIATAFRDLGIGSAYDTLDKGLSRITDAAGRIPPQYKALLTRLDAFKPGDSKAQATWTLATGDQPIVAATRYNLDLGASAAITLDGAAADWDTPTKALLSLNASGKADADAKGTLPLAYGSLSAGAAAAANLGLTYFFDVDRQQLFAAAAAGCLGGLADPFDFDAVWTGMQQPSLKGVTLTYGGTASGQIQVTLGDALSLGRGVVANLGLSVGVTAAYKTVYTLTLQRVATAQGFNIKARLARAPTTTVGDSASLGVNVDFSALTKPVTDALDKALGDWDKTLGEIRPFLSPGTWLRGKAAVLLQGQIAQMVQDPDIRAALTTDMDAALGLQTITDEAVTNWLTDQIVDAFQRGSALVDGDVTAASARIFAAFKSVAPNVATAAASRLSALYQTALTQANAALKDAVNRALTQPLGTPLAQALDAAGAQVSKAVNTLDDALAGVRDLLNRIDQKFHGVLTTAEQALKSHVTARLYRTDSRTSGVTVEADGVFTDATDHARDVYRAMALGKLQSLIDLLDAQDTPGFTLDRAASSVTRFSKSKSEEGAEIAFLNFALTGSRVLQADATSMVDGLGNVHVDTSGSLTSTIASPLNTRQVSFVDSYALVLAGALKAGSAAGPPTLEAGVGATFTDKSLTWGDIQAFVGGLTAPLPLISPAAAAKAGAIFQSWTLGPDGGPRLSGSIGAVTRLKGQQIETLLRLGDRSSGGTLSDDARRQIVTTGLSVLRAVGAIGRPTSGLRDQFTRGLDHARSQFTHQGLGEADAVLNYRSEIGDLKLPGTDELPESNNVDTDFLATLGPSAIEDYVAFLDTAFALGKLVDLIQVMGDLYLSSGLPAGTWPVDKYRQKQQAMVAATGQWLSVLGPAVTLFGAKLTPRTVAFMAIVLELAGVATPGSGGVRLTMTYNSTSGPQTVSFD